MSWLAPVFLVWGTAAVAVLAALHLLARRRPPPEELPTAQFVSARALRLTSRGLAPSDALLFVIRALALVAIASAFAAPLVTRSKARVRRVVLVDVSRAVARLSEVRDSVRAILQEGDALVSFDSAARRVTSVDSLSTRDALGSLSSGLIAASRAAATLADRADSLELVVVTPLLDEELDEAIPVARASWAGRARLVRVASSSRDTTAHSIDIEAGDDPLLAALRLRGPASVGATLRVRRSAPNAADSAWARSTGHVLVHWPRIADVTARWPGRDRVDTVGGVVAGRTVVVAPFVREWTLDGRVVARWIDGEAAAVEHTVGAGCIRDVGIGVNPASDIPLRPEFARLTTVLLAPCGGIREARPASDSVVAGIVGGGPLATSESFRSTSRRRSPWTPWLLAAAFLLLALEWGLRRERREAVA